MREIRFRGRDQQGEWVYGSLIRFSEDHNEIVSDDKWKHPGHQALQVDTQTIGQYTGLKDKNAVEIYEGDIVRWPGDEGVAYDYKVEWVENGWFADGQWVSDINDVVAIIGNIYENPELLA